MLHFLLGVALCLFIGERLVHYWSAYRLRRDTRRALAPPPTSSPPYDPMARLRRRLWLRNSLVVMALGLAPWGLFIVIGRLMAG